MCLEFVARLGYCQAPSNLVNCLNACNPPTVDCYNACYR